MNENKFNEDLKQMSVYVYKNGNGKIPNGWKRVRTDSNDKTGYYAEAYKKDREIIIVYRGTDKEKGANEFLKDFIKSDVPMGANLSFAQLKDAQNTYNSVAKENPSSRIVLTGHSLGGSLAQIVSAETGRKAVTFNAYATGKILADKGIKNQRLLDITNYGHSRDPVFISNRDYQPGTTLVTNTNLDPEQTYSIKQEISKYCDKDIIPDFDYHSAEKMDSLENAVNIDKDGDNSHQLLLKARISYDEGDDRTLAQKFDDKIRSKYSKMKNEKLQKVFGKSKSGNSSSSGNGRWVTINGAHVYLD